MNQASSGFVPKAPTIPAQIEATTRPKAAFPPDACDTHVHIYGPQGKYPHGPAPGYIPNLASTAQLHAMLGVIGCGRAVIVQPSYYGYDNSCTVDAVIESAGQWLGIGAVPPDVGDAEIERLWKAGIRGIRLNLKGSNGQADTSILKPLAERLKGSGMHLQLYFYADHMPRLDEDLARLPIEVVIDHIGYVRAKDGVDGSGFQMLQRLARGGLAWFKISAPYRQSSLPPHFPDVAPLAHALFALAPDRCVWGSDWPHASRNDTGVIRVPNDGELADAFIDYFPDSADRKRILVDNPARLYGY